MKGENEIIKIAFAVGLICLLVYLPALSCGFINVDDPDYVLNNQLIRQLDGKLFVSAFTQVHVGWWMPLTWLSFAVDYHFWGLNPLGYHLTNIVLHAVNAGLVVFIANRICWRRFACGDDSRFLYPGVLLLAGLLFGIHPLRVESVAWVTERKDVLNGFFSLGSILFYLRYAQEKKEGARAYPAYLLSLLFLVFSLMAKSVSVVIPAMLLVVDWYPLGRFRQGRIRLLLLEKVPYLVLAAAISFATVYFAAQSQYLVSYKDFPLGWRILVSGNAIFEYCRLILCPVGILPVYIIPRSLPFAYSVKTGVVAAIFFSVYAARKHRWMLASWLLFFIPLLPVLAFAQNGGQAFAARFTYLPSLAPSIAGAVLFGEAIKRMAGAGGRWARLAATSVVTALLLFYAGVSVRLIGSWKDTGTFWSRVIELNPMGRAYRDRGAFYHLNGKFDAALADYSVAIEIANDVGMPYIYNLFAFRGTVYADLRRYDEAEKDFTVAISMFPHPTYYYHRGLALKALGRLKEAEADFERAGPNPLPIDWFQTEQ